MQIADRAVWRRDLNAPCVATGSSGRGAIERMPLQVGWGDKEILESCWLRQIKEDRWNSEQKRCHFARIFKVASSVDLRQ
jgi:hypothetical protein